MITQAQIPGLSESEFEQLSIARARRNKDYKRQTLIRARIDAGRELDPAEVVQVPNQAPTQYTFTSVPPFPPLTDTEGNPLPTHLSNDVPMLDAGDVIPQTEEQEAGDGDDVQKFADIQKQYKELKKPSMLERVRYEAAKNKAGIQKKISENRRLLEERERNERNEDHHSEDELFVASEQRAPTGTKQPSSDGNIQPAGPVPAPAPKKRKQTNRISAEEGRRALRVGFGPVRERIQAKNKTLGSSRKGAGASPLAPVAPGPKKGRKKSTAESQPDILSSLSESVLEQAHRSAAIPALKATSARNRQTAVAQLLASIPTENQEKAKEDGVLINQAPKSFNNRLTMDGSLENGFKMKGLKSNLYHYQVLGCAFMRDRENSPDEPRGGMLCDVMGFGKTLQSLANIVDGTPSDPDDPVRTTLIIVQSHLVETWMDEIIKHCDEATIGEVVIYNAQARIRSLNVVKTLLKCSVIITTYDEVRRSYPCFKPPREVSSENDLWEQWQGEFNQKIGPLHQIKFLRIILDEGHEIKNRNSNVSLACRALTARHKWVVTGTPIINGNEEFYPLLDFIGVPDVQNSDYTHFLSYYCSEGDGQKRLLNMARAYMIRRTHASRLFTKPILQLPDIEEKTVEVMFSEAEWILYEAIQNSAIQDINDAGNQPDFVLAQNRCCRTLILRLRMFCDHLLTVQHIIKPLLRAGSLMQDLKRLLQEEGIGALNSSADIVRWLQTVKKDYTSLVQQRRTEQEDEADENQIFDHNSELSDKYWELSSRINQENNWFEILARSFCARCEKEPEKSVVASCLHLYCEDCYCQLVREAEELEATEPGLERSQEVRPICRKCALPIVGVTRLRLDQAEPEEQPVPDEHTPAQKKGKGKKTKMGTGKKKKKGKTSAGPAADEEDDEDDRDWILACGANMPGAKLIKIREIIKGWKGESNRTKVVLFSQFTDTIRILSSMCEDEKWKHHCITGKVPVRKRHKILEEFKSDSDLTVLIVSLKAGGTGIDMTKAHKCILVDLWWNEAIQVQAFCRLLRHGQTERVECVKMVVQGSVDAYMLDLQERKTKEINNTMGEDKLQQRDTMVDLLKLFADVSKDEQGRLTLKSKSRRTRGAWKNAFSSKDSHSRTA